MNIVVVVVLLLMTSLVAQNAAAQIAVGQDVPNELPEPWHRLADLLPSAKEQQVLRQLHLAPNSFVRHLIPHLPVVWMGMRVVPDEVQTRLAELVGPHKLVAIHAGMLLDGRQVYTGVSERDPEFVRCQRALLVLNPASGKMAAATLPVVTMQDDWFALPPLQQVDIDRDGEMELVLKVHHHNGTVEDLDAQHYLRVVGEQLHADIVIREAGWVVEPPNEGGYLRQALLFDGPFSVRLVTWFEYANDANILVPLGQCQLQRPGPRLPFAQVGVTPWVAGAGWRLLPCSSDLTTSR